MSTQNQGVPSYNYAFVDNKGTISPAWYQFMVSLWKRTGGGSSPGIVSSIAVISHNGVTSSVTNPTANATITLGLGTITPAAVAATGNVAGANLSGTNTGNVTFSGENYLSFTGQALSANSVNLGTSNATGTLAAGRFPALVGDITTSVGSLSTALATVNPDVGTFTNATITANAKGLITAAVDNPGLSVTIITAALTTLGTQGSMTFVNGILTAQTPAT